MNCEWGLQVGGWGGSTQFSKIANSIGEFSLRSFFFFCFLNRINYMLRGIQFKAIKMDSKLPTCTGKNIHLSSGYGLDEDNEWKKNFVENGNCSIWYRIHWENDNGIRVFVFFFKKKKKRKMTAIKVEFLRFNRIN